MVFWEPKATSGSSAASVAEVIVVDPISATDWRASAMVAGSFEGVTVTARSRVAVRLSASVTLTRTVVPAAVRPSSASLATNTSWFNQAVALAAVPVYSNPLATAVTPAVAAEDRLPTAGSRTTARTVTLPVPSSTTLQPERLARSAPGALSVLGSATVRPVAVVSTVGAASSPSKAVAANARASIGPVADSSTQSPPRAAAPVSSFDEATSAPVSTLSR
ncbi:Uncharacterised protein [Xylophilus ampelinus]|nr:Uncharacterised protein [Xylophilus ampelinus]